MVGIIGGTHRSSIPLEICFHVDQCQDITFNIIYYGPLICVYAMMKWLYVSDATMWRCGVKYVSPTSSLFYVSAIG
jgi:hypothetical protein